MDSALLLNTLVDGKDLTAEQTREFLEGVIRGEMTPAQIAGVLVALRMKGETPAEIEGLVEAMREHMTTVEAPGAIDIVGTGGDGSGTFNVSTASALVVAGAGVGVAKHGNRAASSKCGSADVLEALGVKIDLSKEQAEHVYKKAGIVFLFAPLFHGATKNVVAVRKELKIRTIFNVLGPFANPAGTKRQLVGVANLGIAKKMTEAARSLAYERILIVTSEDGMDEISLSAKTHAINIEGRKVKKFTIDPAKLGFKKVAKADILGGNAQHNAQIVRDILDGKKGAKRDIVLLNSAFALLVVGVVKTAKEGIERAAESIDSGKAKAALERLIQESNTFVTKP